MRGVFCARGGGGGVAYACAPFCTEELAVSIARFGTGNWRAYVGGGEGRDILD